ncbi:MAG: nucleotidyltransferase family protein [Candidatus Micrarchaeia archaeon]
MLENAILLAGGKGTRLRPLTFDVPKPLIKINGKPIIEYALEELERNGISKVYVSLGYKAQKVIKYLEHRKKFGADIEYVIESKPLGTGGAIRYAMGKMQRYEDVAIVYGDTIFSAEMQKMHEFHKEMGALVTIGSTVVENVKGFGVLEEKDGRVVGFVEKPEPSAVKSKMVNSGIYIVNRSIVEKFPKLESFSFEKDFLQKVYTNEKIFHHPIGKFITVNDIEQYKKAKEAMRIAGGEI